MGRFNVSVEKACAVNQSRSEGHGNALLASGAANAVSRFVRLPSNLSKTSARPDLPFPWTPRVLAVTPECPDGSWAPSPGRGPAGSFSPPRRVPRGHPHCCLPVDSRADKCEWSSSL